MAIRTPQEYRQLLKALLDNLEDGASLFDGGRMGQALAMATTLRVLFRSKDAAPSLMDQLAFPQDSPMVSIAGLDQTADELASEAAKGRVTFTVGLEMGGLVPKLDLTPHPDRVPFARWWDEEIVYCNGSVMLTRWQAVALVANKDGGAHVAPRPPRALVEAKKGSGTYTGTAPDGRRVVTELVDDHLGVVRRIAEEVLLTFGRR